MKLQHQLLSVFLIYASAPVATSTAAQKASPVPETVLQAKQVGRDLSFDQVRRILLGPDGNYYVLDAGNNRIVVLSPTWTFVRQISEVGQGPGELFDPYDLALDRKGSVYVIDSKSRVQEFSSEGKYFGSLGYQAECLALAVNGRGEFLLSQPGRGALVTVYGSNGELRRSFGTLKGGKGHYQAVANRVHIFVTREDDVYLSFDHQGLLQKYDASGRLLWEAAIPGEQVERLRRVFWSDAPDKSKYGMVFTTAHSRISAFYVSFNVFFDESRRQLYVPLNDGSIYIADTSGKPVRFMKQPPGAVDFYNSIAVDNRGRLLATSVWRGVLLIVPAHPV